MKGPSRASCCVFHGAPVISLFCVSPARSRHPRPEGKTGFGPGPFFPGNNNGPQPSPSSSRWAVASLRLPRKLLGVRACAADFRCARRVVVVPKKKKKKKKETMRLTRRAEERPLLCCPSLLRGSFSYRGRILSESFCFRFIPSATF